ncbi:MAG: NADH-quinone oxidoreductase subunit L [Capsulimonadales bacterium]|nr:NADH-quinone oxidoreductase subunit L [Capsulimonadales bacterium]
MNTSDLPWLVVLLPLVGFLINAFLGARLTGSPKPVPEAPLPPHVSYEMEPEEEEAGSASDEPAASHDGHGQAHGPDAGHDHDHFDPKNKGLVGGIATVSVFLSFLLSVMLFLQIGGMAGEEKRILTGAIEWMAPIGLNLQLAVDPLSALMLLIITGVGSLIHLYSIGYMGHDRGFARYFAYLNLFIFFMLLLVLGANLAMLFVGWEGVGLASYLLIGFWYRRDSASAAANKAFIVNRIGDCALLIALFALYKYFGTLDLYGAKGILTQAGQQFADQNGYPEGAVNYVPLLLFLGAAGKSAQIPLYTWLPDAMEGPTPVSALIHAATMVTGGVYLVCRTYPLFLSSPNAMTVVAVVGLVTATLAATIACTQTDIKKVLAYSTVSQLGYMFLACGVGAFGAAMFHVATHAFFKALLFLGSGSVIHAMGGEQDMRKMGGLRAKLPVTFLTMAVGTLAIAGVPGLAGFFSKDEILANAFASEATDDIAARFPTIAGGLGHPLLFIVGLAVAGLTAFYMGRMMLKTFMGAPRYDAATANHLHESPAVMTLPLWILAALSLIGGFLPIEHFIEPSIHWRGEALHLDFGATKTVLMVVSGAVALLGLGYAWMRFGSAKNGEYLPVEKKTAYSIWWLIYNKWLVDDFYQDVVVDPGRRFARWLWRVVDVRVTDGLTGGWGTGIAHLASVIRHWQSGYVRNYALSMLAGVVLVVIGALLGMMVGRR